MLCKSTDAMTDIKASDDAQNVLVVEQAMFSAKTRKEQLSRGVVNLLTREIMLTCPDDAIYSTENRREKSPSPTISLSCTSSNCIPSVQHSPRNIPEAVSAPSYPQCTILRFPQKSNSQHKVVVNPEKDIDKPRPSKRGLKSSPETPVGKERKEKTNCNCPRKLIGDDPKKGHRKKAAKKKNSQTSLRETQRPKRKKFKCKKLKPNAPMSAIMENAESNCCACCQLICDYLKEVYYLISLKHTNDTHISQILGEICEAAGCLCHNCCTFVRKIGTSICCSVKK